MINLIKNALASIKAHKLRVFMAIIWIVIGITAVIIIGSIGKGAEIKIQQSIEKVVSKNFSISYEDSSGMIADYIQPFTMEDIEQLTFLEGVSKIGKNDENSEGDFWANITSADIKYDTKESYSEFKGVEFDDKNKSKYKIIYGRNFAIEDMERNVVILTKESAEVLFENLQDAIGKGVEINGRVFEIIGISEEKINEEDMSARSFLENLNDSFEQMENPNSMIDDYWYLTSFVPKNKFEEINSFWGDYGNEIYALNISIASGYDFYDVSSKVIEKLHDLHPDLEGSYIASDPNEMMEETEYIKEALNSFVKIITFISLFVGGIGIMNFMYVSVIERQREVAIRRSIGARPFNIMFQFLIESVFITFVGGIIGVISGIFAVAILSIYLPFKAIIDSNILILSLVSSVATGIIFGVVPAFKASTLDPVKVLTK